MPQNLEILICDLLAHCGVLYVGIASQSLISELLSLSLYLFTDLNFVAFSPQKSSSVLAMIFFIIVVVHIELITSTNLDMDAN